MAKQPRPPQPPPPPNVVEEQVTLPAPAAPVAPAALPQAFGACYVFRLRKHVDGPFPNLWELSMLDPASCEPMPVKKLISDADSLVYCLDNMQGELEADGL